MRRQMCHSVQQENSPPDLATLEWSRAAGGLRRVAMAGGSRRPALTWVGPLGTARRHSGAAERLTLNGANHRSALPVAASGSSGAARARLDGSTRAIQPHRIPALHCPSLSSHARMALSHVRWMSAAWVWTAAAVSRLLRTQIRSWVCAGCTS
jgi:hypothetical protein